MEGEEENGNGGWRLAVGCLMMVITTWKEGINEN